VSSSTSFSAKFCSNCSRKRLFWCVFDSTLGVVFVACHFVTAVRMSCRCYPQSADILFKAIRAWRSDAKKSCPSRLFLCRSTPLLSVYGWCIQPESRRRWSILVVLVVLFPSLLDFFYLGQTTWRTKCANARYDCASPLREVWAAMSFLPR